MTKDAWKRFGDAGYKHYCVVAAGFKYNMMDLQAAIGLKQLARVEAYWLRRKAIWERYMDELADLPIELPPKVALDTRHAYHLFTIQLDKASCGVARDDFLEAMTAEGIGIGVHYLALTEHPYYQQAFGWRPEDTPHATRVGRGTVSLPISAKLTDQDVTDVISAARLILR
jgi:dTDP-4-amino-4,6-dideoxygalactose transaminase